MKFKFSHNNFNVLNLEKSLAFYSNALNLKEVRRVENPDFTLVFLQDEQRSYHTLELTWMKERKEGYNLGDNEFHLAFEVNNISESLEKHSKMGIVVYHNKAMGIYFIEDPDGYWIEILPIKN